jgi:hypothetical protein
VVVLVINMKKIFFLLVILLTHLAHADTTFFDNPDDAFIMGNAITIPPTSGGIEEIIGRTTGEGGCLYKWNCTNWGECLPSRKQIRECVNIGNCPNTYKTPEIEKNCTYIALKNENRTTGEIGGEKFENKSLYFVIILILVFFIFSIIHYLTKFRSS